MSNDGNNGASASSTDVGVPEVHSANDWESVDLGDTQRKAKFLRLMGGASATKHAAPTTPNKPEEKESAKTEGSSEHHARTRRPASKDIEEKLTHQYEESMANHLKHRDQRHRGLGYQGDTQVDLEAAPSVSNSATKLAEKRSSTNDNGKANEDVSPPKKPRIDEVRFTLESKKTAESPPTKSKE